MLYEDKKYTIAAKKYNYVSDYDDHTGWCRECVHFGEEDMNLHWLCSQNFPEIACVSYCGHCDKFSSTHKINLLKYYMLKMRGFKFQNKAR